MMKKILKITGITLLSLVVILAILPFAFEGKIYQAVQEQANKNLNATVRFSDVHLSLLRNFPHLRVTVDSLQVDNKAPFDGVRLADIPSFTLVINIKSLFSDQIEINQIILDQPHLDVRCMADGKANYDIAIPDTVPPPPTEEPSKPISMSLEYYALKNADIRYDDKSLAMVLDLKNMTHEGEGNFADEVFTLSTLTKADKGTFWFDGITYVKEADTEIKADLSMDLGKMRFEFKDNEVRLNQLFLQCNGWVNMPEEDIDMDITFAATKTDFKNLLSMVPMEFAKDLDGVEASGNIALNGFVKGTYNDTSMPGIGLNVSIENGKFKYPDLPKSVDDVQVKLAVLADMNNEDNTTVDLNRCHLSIASNPIDVELHLRTPESNPFVDFMGKMNIDLATLKDVIPIGKEESVQGKIKADMKVKGHVGSIEKDYATLEASGLLDITDMDYESDSLPYDIFIKHMHLDFTPAYADMTDLNMTVGKSSMQMNGKVTQYLEYAIQDKELVGVLNFHSPGINLNDFMSSESETAEEPVASSGPSAQDTSNSIIVLPNNIDFTLNSTIDKLLYDKATFDHVQGNIHLLHGRANLDNISMNGLGGSMQLNGWYDGNEGTKPEMDLGIKLNQVDIQNTVTTFATLGKWSSALKTCQGKMSLNVQMKTALDKQMMPINNTVDATGNLNTKEVSIQNYAPLVKLADKTGLDKWKKPLVVKDINVGFTIKNGIIKTAPFVVKVDDVPMKIEGQSTLDQKIDYSVETDIPFEKFPSGLVNQANSLLGQVNSKMGTN